MAEEDLTTTRIAKANVEAQGYQLDTSKTYHKGKETGNLQIENFHYYDKDKGWIRLQAQEYFPIEGKKYIQFATQNINVSEKVKWTETATMGTVGGVATYGLASYLGFASSLLPSFGVLGIVLGGWLGHHDAEKRRQEYLAGIESPYGKVSSAYQTADVWGGSYTELIKKADMPPDMYWGKDSQGLWNPVFVEKSRVDSRYAFTSSKEGLNPDLVAERKESSTWKGIGASLLSAVAGINVPMSLAIGLGTGLYADKKAAKSTEMQRYELV